MAERAPASGVTDLIRTSLGPFRLRETVAYPNGGHSSFYVRDNVAIIVDDGICARESDQPVFDYSLITNKQNAYVARYERVYRFLAEDLVDGLAADEGADENPEEDLGEGAGENPEEDPSENVNKGPAEVERFLNPRVDIELQDGVPLRQSADRANVAVASPLEIRFEEHFANVYGGDSARYLWREYAVTDLDGRVRYVDYVVRTKHGLLGVEENGVSYHHPQIIGLRRWRDQLLKQNSCQLAGIRLFRFSSEDCRFVERLEDDIRSYFGATSNAFLDAGMVVERPFELYEHQGDALAEMERRRREGTRSFLAVFPTASGKSQIVLEDLARFASARPGCHALVMAPTRAIVDDWQRRVRDSLPTIARDVLVCTYGHINRHYTEFSPGHFDYVVVDEAHHAVAPALKRTIQYFDPVFLVGLTATDQRPDKRRLEEVFGSYRVGLSLADAMERGIVATARAFRIETNVDLSHVRISGKDYVNADLEKRVRVTSRNELIVEVLQRYFCERPGDLSIGAKPLLTNGSSVKRGLAPIDKTRDASRLQGVIFCVNVRHTKEMERLLRDAGIPARALNGSTPHPERVMDDFRAGRIRFLCSCQMISEGWDYPELGILVMARPTLSRVLYLQQLGRGLRRTPSKRDVFVIDVVDEYGTMAAPCSLHSVFQNPYYVPFGDILRRDYELGEWVEVDGIHERIERIVEVDATSFAERYEGYLSVEQVAREYFVSTDTVNAWIRRGRLAPTASFAFGNRRVHLFSPEDVEEARVRLGIPVHDDETIRDDFLAFLEARDYSLSYKMPFLLSFLDHMDPSTGAAQIDEVLNDYIAFYADRLRQGLPVDRPTCPYNETTLADRAFVRRNMLANPFEKFERKRFMYYSRDLGQISLNHALLARLDVADYDAVRAQMHTDLAAYYEAL